MRNPLCLVTSVMWAVSGPVFVALFFWACVSDRVTTYDRGDAPDDDGHTQLRDVVVLVLAIVGEAKSVLEGKS